MARHTKSSEKPTVAQIERFREKARELGCDEDEAVFEERLQRIVPKPKKEEENSGRD